MRTSRHATTSFLVPFQPLPPCPRAGLSVLPRFVPWSPPTNWRTFTSSVPRVVCVKRSASPWGASANRPISATESPKAFLFFQSYVEPVGFRAANSAKIQPEDLSE